MDVQDLMHPIWIPLEKMTPEEKDAELSNLRAAWDWTCDKVRYFAVRGGRDVVIVTRSNKRYYGVLGVVSMEPDEITATVESREWNPKLAKQQDELKTIVIGYPMVVNVETIIETEVVQDALANGGPSDDIARQLIGSVTHTEGDSNEDDSAGRR